MRTLPRPLLAAALPLALLVADVAAVAAQTRLRHVRTVREVAGAPLYRVRAADLRGGELALLTEPGPAVHLVTAEGTRSWGEKGSGPAELLNPYDVAWAGDRLLVRDSQLRKVVSYDRSGEVVATRRFPGGAFVSRLDVTGSDTLAELFSLRGEQTVVRLRGERLDTVLRYAVDAPTVRLSAPGSPSLTLPAPFSARPLWTALPGGRVAFWDGASAEIRLLSLDGRAVGRLPLPAGRVRVTGADREAWLASGIPEGVRGERVFAGLRRTARETVEFPALLPAALALRADAAGGVWVRRTRSSTGERWVRLAPGERPRTLRLPRRQGLLAIGDGEFAVLAFDDDGAERVDVYRDPGAARVAIR